MYMKYFRVKYGYGKDEFLSIDETEYRKALMAQGSGGVTAFSSGTIAGNNIMAIIPDYQKVMGYNRDYELQGEDYQEIGTARQNEYQQFMNTAKLALEGKSPSQEQPKELQNDIKKLADGMRIKP